MTNISLSTNDPDPSGRVALIDKANQEYLWDHTFLPNYALLHEPGTDKPSLWQALTEGKFDGLPAGEIPGSHSDYANLRKTTGKPAFERLLEDRVKGFFQSLLSERELRSPADYAQLIPENEMPAAADHWAEDEFFAWQRVAGPNPVMLRRLAAPPEEFAIEDARLPDGATLAGLAEVGALYLCDYAWLEGLPMQVHEGTRVHAPPAKALFGVTHGKLRPLAIQIDQAAVASRVFTPADGASWTMAKLAVQTADLNVHEIITHLARTHFTLEGVAVATNRALPSRHPIHALLWPHLRFLIFNNFEGRELLVNPRGWATELLAGGGAGNTGLLERSRLGYSERNLAPWHIDDWHLPNELASRGVDDASMLPDYPFRDDGLPIWHALGAFVREYVEHYFDSDEVVATDTETQRWAKELSDPRGAGLNGVAPELSGREALADLVQRIIWAAGPLHCAVNFPQYDYMAFVPNMPAGLYDAPWDGPGPIDNNAIMRMLPPETQATLQVFTVRELTSFHYDKLGHYAAGAFPNDVTPIITRFQAALDRAGDVIRARDEARRWKYQYLFPENILNSTSI